MASKLYKFGLALGLAVVIVAPAVWAASTTVQWASTGNVLTSNGAITVQTVSGSSYSGTENPSGATVKMNQIAVTQPPTVIMNITSGVNPWSLYYNQRAGGLTD